MKIAVRYYTKTGNTKRLAEAIAEAVGVEALPISEPVGEPVDLLFLGNSRISLQQTKIERYYREAIKDPYIGVLMMIIDDTNKNQGEKRKTILDPELAKAGIKCRFYGNKFLAYFTFSK